MRSAGSMQRRTRSAATPPMSFDAAGSRTGKVDGRGSAITYGFDAGRQSSVCSTGMAPGDERFRRGQRVGRRRRRDRQLDPRLRCRWEVATDAGPSHPNGNPLTNSYHPTGNRTVPPDLVRPPHQQLRCEGNLVGLSHPAGYLTTWAFDALGRMSPAGPPRRWRHDVELRCGLAAEAARAIRMPPEWCWIRRSWATTLSGTHS